MKLSYVYVIDYKGENPRFCYSKFSLVCSLIRMILIGLYDLRVSREIVCDRRK